MDSLNLRRPAYSFGAFGLVLLSVYGAACWIVTLLVQSKQPDVLATAVACDLVILVPAAFYLLIVLPLHLPRILVVPCVTISLFSAAQLIPADHHFGLNVIEYALLVPEALLIGWVVLRTQRLIRSAQSHTGLEPLERYRREFKKLIASPAVAEVFASEMALFHYALAAWRSTPHRPDGTISVSQHTRSGQSGIVIALMSLFVIEGVAVHLLLAMWSEWLAWLLTASTVYGGLFLLGDLRATVLRPILIEQDRITLRAGLRWTVEVERDNILSITSHQPADGMPHVNFVLLGQPTRWLQLREPVVVRGMYGFQRVVHAIGFCPDQPDLLDELGKGNSNQTTAHSES